jgi:hypothetical protein
MGSDSIDRCLEIHRSGDRPMTIVASFPQSEAEQLEPQIDGLIQAHSLTESGRWAGMGFVDTELSGDRSAVSAFAGAAAVLDDVHLTEQP